MKISIDFETRSEADLKVVGAWMYSIHPSTSVMCIEWNCSNGERGLWHRAHRTMPEGGIKALQRLHELLPGALVESHNAFFERAIWNNICVPKMGWPAIADDRWRCSAAKAAACALPRPLGQAGIAMKLSEVKDEEGKRIMMKLSRPRKPTKKNPEVWSEDEDDLMELWEYCEQDVVAEKALSAALPNLSKTEQEVWAMSERMNIRGVPLDIVGIKKAINLANQHSAMLTKELNELTGLRSAAQRQKLIVWFGSRGMHLMDTQGATIDKILDSRDPLCDERDDKTYRVMEIMRSLNRSSVSKYESMLAMTAPDGRARGLVMYHGASTGRWTGMGMQPHNFPRTPKKFDQDAVWRAIHEENLNLIDLAFGEPMTVLSHALRGAIKAPRGRVFYCGDYAAIEARVVFWLAGERQALDMFRRNEDVYLDMASTIYNRRVAKDEEDKRFVGKQTILGLGFQMGFPKYLKHIRSFDIHISDRQVHEVLGAQVIDIINYIRGKAWKQVKRTIPDASEKDLMELAFAKYVTDKYRSKYKRVVQLWTNLNAAAISAVSKPEIVFKANMTSWYFKGNFLRCKLPSGRMLFYPFPEIHEGEYGSPSLTFMGVDGKTHQWVRQSAYGGIIANNATQGSARDIEAAALVRLEKTGLYDPVLAVHDEVLSETDEGRGNLEEYLDIMTHGSESWTTDLPIAAEGWVGERYRKA